MSTGPVTIGRYQVRDRLGQGGMGVLYLALDPAIDRLVALKVLRVDNEEMRERFLREARLAARLQHPNIVTIYDVGSHEGQPFIAMEYISGETLAELIQRRAPLAVERKLELMLDACQGLAYAHRHGIVHRDIKPANLMVGRDAGVLKVLDFGIARGADSTLTQIGMLMGTPNYMSPEQVEGRTIDQRSDIFAVGLVFYELLAYRQAFRADTPHAVLHAVLHSHPTPLTNIAPDLDRGIGPIVDRAIAKDVNARYQDLEHLRLDLLKVIQRIKTERDQPTMVTPVPGGIHEAPQTPKRTPPPSADRMRLAERRAAQVATHLEAAEQALSAGDLEGAQAAAESAALLDQEDVRVTRMFDRIRVATDAREIANLLGVARQHLAQGQLTEANQAVAQALQIDSQQREAQTLKVQIERAVEEREQQRRREQAAARALQRVEECVQAGAYEGALRAIAEAAGYDPQNSTLQAARERVLALIDQRAHEEIAAARNEVAANQHERALHRLMAFTPWHTAVDQELKALQGVMAEIIARRQEEEAARQRAEEERRQREAEEARRRAEEEARKRAAEEARRKAEEEARRQAEEEARRKAAEEAARKKAEEEAARKAEDERRRKAYEEARKKVDEEKRLRAEAAKKKADDAARKKAAEEEAARVAAEAEARRQAEEAAKAKAAEEQRQRAAAAAAEEARKQAAAAEAARTKAAEEQRQRAAATAAEEARKQAEAQRRAEEAARAKAAEEQRRQAAAAAAEEARKQAAAEAQKRADEAARAKAAEEQRRQAAASEEARKQAAADAQRRAEGEARQRAEAEARRKADEAARAKAAEEQRQRAAAASAEGARKQAATEAQRRADAEARQRADAEARRKADEAARAKTAEEQRQRAEAEARRKAEEERARQTATRVAAIAAASSTADEATVVVPTLKQARPGSPPSGAHAPAGGGMPPTSVMPVSRTAGPPPVPPPTPAVAVTPSMSSGAADDAAFRRRLYIGAGIAAAILILILLGALIFRRPSGDGGPSSKDGTGSGAVTDSGGKTADAGKAGAGGTGTGGTGGTGATGDASKKNPTDTAGTGGTASSLTAAQQTELNETIEHTRRHLNRHQRNDALKAITEGVAKFPQDKTLPSLMLDLIRQVQGDADRAHTAALNAQANVKADAEFKRGDANYQDGEEHKQKNQGPDAVRAFLAAEDHYLTATTRARQVADVNTGGSQQGQGKGGQSQAGQGQGQSGTGQPGGQPGGGQPQGQVAQGQGGTGGVIPNTGAGKQGGTGTPNPGGGQGQTGQGQTGQGQTGQGQTGQGQPGGGQIVNPPPPPPPVNEKPAIQQAIDRLGAAYASLDTSQVAAAYPTISSDQLNRLKGVFRDVSSYVVTYHNCAIADQAPRATATCDLVRRITYKVQGPQQFGAKITFRLEKRGGTWVIVDQSSN